MIERNNINIVLNFITGYLSIEKIPYAIVGGLSVIGYGLDRETDDIDIDVPDIYLEKINQDLNEFITEPLYHEIGDKFDCKLICLEYEGEKIEISGGDSLRIYDQTHKRWKDFKTDFNKVVKKEIFGVPVNLISIEQIYQTKKIAAAREKDFKDLMFLESLI